MIDRPVTIEELENTDFIAHTDKSLNTLAERISKESPEKQEELFGNLIDERFILHPYFSSAEKEEYYLKVTNQIKKLLANPFIAKAFKSFVKVSKKNNSSNSLGLMVSVKAKPLSKKELKLVEQYIANDRLKRAKKSSKIINKPKSIKL